MTPATRLSIRARLALIYTALLAAALAAFGTGIYVVLRDQLEHSFDAQLLANAEHAAGAFAQDVGVDGRLVPSNRLVTQFASTGGRVLVLDRVGSVLADSAPASPALKIGAGQLSAAAAHEHVVSEQSTGTVVVRVAIEPVTAAAGVIGYVAWADSTSSLRSLLATVATALVLGGVITVLLALVAGLVLARRALTPVARVTETARAISLSGDFGARVERADEHDEVGELALAFNEMLAALESNHHALQRFLGDASHQLRTPLTSIRANLDLALRPDLPREERDAILADARDEAERMARLIGDLLSLARAESGARLEFATTELDALVVESVRRAAQAAPHIRMSVGAVEPALVEGDRDRLRELFGILLDNAARYTPKGGSVTVRQSIRANSALVTIEDTGIGIGDEDPDLLFERLYRGSTARQARPSGTGLGLAIAKWIAEAHGGAVMLRNRPDDGSSATGAVATVELPVVRR